MMHVYLYVILHLYFDNFFSVNASFVALKSSSGDIQRNYSLITGVTNLISCSRHCRGNSECKGFVYNETNKICGLEKGQNETSGETIGTVFQVKSHAKQSCGQFQHLLSVDTDGEIISGTFEYFKTKIVSGAKVRFVLTNKDNESLSFGIKSAFINEHVICTQGQVYHSKYGNFLSYQACSTGHVHRFKIPRDPAENAIISIFTDNDKIDWFGLDDTCQQVLLTDKSKLNVANNGNHNLFSMTVHQQHDTFVQMNYFTYTDLSKGSKIELIHTGEIATYFNGEDFNFDNNASWVSWTFSFSDDVEKLMCSVNNNKSCVNNIKTLGQKFYLNGNWEKIFTKLVSSISDTGELATLRNLVLKGQETMIYFKDKFMEPDIIFVDSNDVTAIFATYPLKSDSNQTYLLWDLVSTSGKYESITFDYLTGNVINVTVDECNSSWFVDETVWTTLDGTKQEIIDRVEDIVTSGYPIRIKSNCLHLEGENVTSVSCIYDGHFIYLNHSCQRQISRSNLYPYPNIDSNGLHLNASDNPLWMTLASHSVERVMRRLYTYRSPFYASKYYECLDDVTWFANFN